MPKDRQINRPWDKTASGARLSSLRELRGITQRELAEEAEVDKQKVSNTEYGLVLCDDETYRKFGFALGVLPESLKVIGLRNSENQKKNWANNIAIRAIFQMSKLIGLRPRSANRFAYLEPTNRVSEEIFGAMLSEHRRYATSIDSAEDVDARRAVYLRHLLWRSAVDGDIAYFVNRYKSAESFTQPTYGETVKRLRTERNLTQKALAKLLGVDPRIVRTYESDAWKPRERANFALAQTLGVQPEALIPLGQDSAAQAVQTLLDVSESFWLVPDEVSGEAIVRTQSRDLEKALDSLALVWGEGEKSGDDDRLQKWYDTYDDAHARRVRPSRYDVRHRWEDERGGRHLSWVSDSEWQGRLLGI